MGNFDDGISIAVAVTIVVTVGFVQEYRSEKSLEALNQLVPHFAHIIRGEMSARIRSQLHAPKEDGAIEMESLMETAEGLEAAASVSSTVPAAQLVPGDLVLFRTGDRIPADIRITQSVDLSIDSTLR